MGFGDHVSWLGRLSAQASFESEKLKFLKDGAELSNQIDSGRTKVNRELGHVEGVFYDRETNQVEEFSYSFSAYILKKTKRYTHNPISHIIEPIAHDNIEARIEAWLNILNRTKLRVEANDYYDIFPAYRKSIDMSITALQGEKNFDSVKSGKHGDKEQKAYELQDYLNIIENAGSHEKAIAQLKKECSEFSWDRPQKKLIFPTTGGLNKSQASYALLKIAKIKWPETYPSAETIRKYLLK